MESERVYEIHPHPAIGDFPSSSPSSERKIIHRAYTENAEDYQPPAKKQHLEDDDQKKPSLVDDDGAESKEDGGAPNLKTEHLEDNNQKQWPVDDVSESEEDGEDLKAYVESDAHKAAVAELNAEIAECMKHEDFGKDMGLADCPIPADPDECQFEDPYVMAGMAIADYNQKKGTVFKVEKVMKMQAAVGRCLSYYLRFTATGAVARSVTFKACVRHYDLTTKEKEVVYCKFHVIWPGFDYESDI